MHVTMNTIGERISCWEAGLQPSQLLKAGSQLGYCHARVPQPRATAMHVSLATGYCHAHVPGHGLLGVWPCHGSEHPGGCSRRGVPMGIGDGWRWPDKGVPCPRSPGESHVLRLSPAATPRSSSGRPRGTVTHSGPAQAKNGRGFPVWPPLAAPCTQPLKPEAADHPPPAPRKTHPSPCPGPRWLSPPAHVIILPRFSSFGALQAALQVPVTRRKWGILPDSCGGITYRRKAR